MKQSSAHENAPVAQPARRASAIGLPRDPDEVCPEASGFGFSASRMDAWRPIRRALVSHDTAVPCDLVTRCGLDDPTPEYPPMEAMFRAWLCPPRRKHQLVFP